MTLFPPATQTTTERAETGWRVVVRWLAVAATTAIIAACGHAPTAPRATPREQDQACVIRVDTLYTTDGQRFFLRFWGSC